MGFKRLEKNLIDIIKEEQAKLGFRKEEIRLYYPLISLNHFFEADDDVDEMQTRLEQFPEEVKKKLGDICVTHKKDRFCLHIPEQGSVYVHEHTAENEFIKKLVARAGIAPKDARPGLAYAIGKVKPVMVEVDAHGTGKYSDTALEQAVRTVCKLTPNGMIDALGLNKPIFRKFCNYGHFTHADAPWEQTDMTEVLESACRAKEAGVSQR